MRVILKDNTPLPPTGGGAETAARCLAIQDLVDHGRCSLIDLRGNMRSDRPRIFRKDAAGTLWTGNLIGVFEYRAGGRAEKVLIADRFGPEQAAGDGGFLSFFSWVMLEQCWDETPLWLLNESRAAGTGDIFDQLLMLRLAAQMERAWKKGRLRLYRTVSRYDSRVQGQMDLSRKIRRSMGLEDGNMACQVREYSEDNLYSQLFFQACLQAERRHPALMRRLKRQMPGFRLARQALEQQAAAWGRCDLRGLLNGTRKKITNPLYRDYETLRDVARAVLRRTSGSYACSESGAPFVTGIFLDISQLWEDYLAQAVFSALSSRPREQGGAEGNLPILEGMLKIRPDFWWKDEGCILDAKFRPVWSRFLTPSSSEEDRRRIQHDVYQVLSYMLTLDCRRGGVIFPVRGGRSGQDPLYQEHQAVSGRRGQSFWLIPFFVPQLPDYEAFSGAMRAEAGNVRRAAEAFLNVL